MIGTGLIATPTANVNTALIPCPIALPRSRRRSAHAACSRYVLAAGLARAVRGPIQAELT